MTSVAAQSEAERLHESGVRQYGGSGGFDLKGDKAWVGEGCFVLVGLVRQQDADGDDACDQNRV